MSQQNIFDDWEENKEAAITSATYNANLDWMDAAKYAGAVSYTHLTLPTILLV